MKVYLIKQTQETEGYFDKTIYICSTKEKAQEYCRKLNETYGYGCKFSKEWDFEYECDDDVHFYNWEHMEVDEDLVLLK